jgi:hypothetical protein
MADETGLVAALKVALDPVPVHWGWAPAEPVEAVPALPIVTVRRSLFSTEGYADMCEQGAIVGDTTLLVHVWSPTYASARALTALVRDTVQAAGGWVLQSEADNYETAFRAWQIEGQWFAGGVEPT